MKKSKMEVWCRLAESLVRESDCISSRERGEKIKQLKKQLDFLENIMEEVLTTYYSGDCYYQLKQDYNTYQNEFYGVKEDRPHKDPGKARAAKTPTKWTCNRCGYINTKPDPRLKISDSYLECYECQQWFIAN